MRCLTTNQLTTTRSRKVMLAEASTIGKLTDELQITSHVTGNVTNWGIVNVDRDIEGDITEWVYIPTADTLAKFPELDGWKTVIIND